MKKLVVFFVVLALFTASSAVYAGQFGPPEPAAKEGKVALGIGYFYYSAKFKSKDWEGDTKATQNQAYLQLGYGIAKNWEAYLRIGGADAKSKELFDLGDSTADFKDSYKPFGTIGVKGVFNVSDSFGIGPFLQASLYSSYKDKKTAVFDGDTYEVTAKYKNPREINLGIGLQGKIGDVIIYGGPVAYWTKFKGEASVTDVATGETETASTTLKEKNNIGGFAGLRVPLSKSLNLEIEGQYKSEFSMGGALTYSF